MADVIAIVIAQDRAKPVVLATVRSDRMLTDEQAREVLPDAATVIRKARLAQKRRILR